MSDTRQLRTAAELPAECGKALSIVVIAAVRRLGSEAVFVAEPDDFAPGVIRLARIGPQLMLVERPGDRTRTKPRRITLYETDEVEPGQMFKLDPDRALFILAEAGFYAPPDLVLTVLVDPARWYNRVLMQLFAVLEPVLTAAAG